MVKQYFIPVVSADQIIEVEALPGQAVAPTQLGDYIAIAGVRAAGYARVFEEGDPDNPNLPLFEATGPITMIQPEPDINGYYHVGQRVEYGDPPMTTDPTTTKRVSVFGRIIDPDNPSVNLATSIAEDWLLPDTSAAGGTKRELVVSIRMRDEVDNRELVVSTNFPIFFEGAAALEYATQPSISAPNLNAGTTATITPPTFTGGANPTVTYQVYANGAERGEPQSGLTFVMSSADTSYSVRALAVLGEDELISEPSNVLKTAAVVSTAPNWTQSWASVTEILQEPYGRLQVTLTSATTLNSNYDYFVLTANTKEVSVETIRTGGQLTGGAQTVMRVPKAIGTVVFPSIFAVSKSVTEGSKDQEGVYLLSTIGYPEGFLIEGVTDPEEPVDPVEPEEPTSKNAIRSLDVPAPRASDVTLAHNYRDKSKFPQGWKNGEYIRCYINDLNNHNSQPENNAPIITIAQAAYYGDVQSINFIKEQLRRWREETYSNSFSSAWTGNDPFTDGCYAANHGLRFLTVCGLALNTPEVYSSLPPEGKLAIGAFFEGCYFLQIALQSNDTSATSNSSAQRTSMLGRKGAFLLSAEPNISCGNWFMLIACHAFFKSEYGKDYIAERGFSDLAAFWSGWSKSGFASFLNSNKMKVGQVSSGKRVCDNMYRMYSISGSFGKSPYTNTVPSNDWMRASWRIGAGPTKWRSSTGGHSLDDLESMLIHGLNRANGMRPGTSTNLGTERSGGLGDLLDTSNPNKKTNPPTGGGGACVAKEGLRWYWGFAAAATVSPVVSAKGTIDGVSWSGNGTEPDFMQGVPQYWFDGKGSWGISGGKFGNRRGYIMTRSYLPCPFEGQPGVISEMDSLDAAGFQRNSSTSSSAGYPRSSTHYANYTIGHEVCVFGLLQALQQGPRNIMDAALYNMSGSWSTGDSNWSLIDKPNNGWYSNKVYTYPAGGSGTSGELVGAAVTARNATHAYMIQLQAATGKANVTVKARFLNASNAVVSEGTIFTGEVGAALVDKDALITRPSGATKVQMVITVNKAGTTGVLRVGGPAMRFRPQSLITWDNPKVKTCMERMRRAMIHWRFAVANGWYDIAKGVNALVGRKVSNSGDRKWQNEWDGSLCYYFTIAPMINVFIPWCRRQIPGFPAINTGFTGWNWEDPVTSANNTGISAK